MAGLSYEDIVRENYKITSSNYRLVYRDVYSGKTLNKLFLKYDRTSYPNQYKGHKLMNSDVIVTCSKGERNAWYVSDDDMCRLSEF